MYFILLGTKTLIIIISIKQVRNDSVSRVTDQSVVENKSPTVFSLYANPVKNEELIYHYTSSKNAKAILKDMLIKTTQSRINTGHGVFMTVLHPNLSNEELLINNYNGNYEKYLEKLQVAFAFKKDAINVIKLYSRKVEKRDVWRHDTPIDLRKVDFFLINRTDYNYNMF